MSAADIELIENKREKLRAEFKTLVTLKKTPEVFARWLKELNALPCT